MAMEGAEVMSATSFDARLDRIRSNGPSGLVTPGAVENTGFSRRKYLNAVQPKQRRRKRNLNLQAVFLAVLLGSVVALMFEKFVGIEALLSVPVSEHLANIQSDQNSAAAFGLVAAGPLIWLIALQLRHKWQGLYQFAVCYVLAMICVSVPTVVDAAGVDTSALIARMGFDAEILADLLPDGTPEFLKVF